MMFSIELFSEKIVDPVSGGLAQRGEIRLGFFREQFLSLIGFWGPRKYRAHWREALARTVDGASASCLITSIADPAQSTRLLWWPVYRMGDVLHVQNAILFFDQLAEPFDPTEPFRFVPERRTMSDDDLPLSEWQVPIQDVVTFLK